MCACGRLFSATTCGGAGAPFGAVRGGFAGGGWRGDTASREWLSGAVRLSLGLSGQVSGQGDVLSHRAMRLSKDGAPKSFGLDIVRGSG